MEKKRTARLLSAAVAIMLAMCSGNSEDKQTKATTYKTSVTIPGKEISLSSSNGKAVFDADEYMHETGSPHLPVITFTFTLPPDTDLAKINTEINGLTEVEMPGVYEIDGSLPPASNGTIKWPKNMNIVNGKNTAIYGKDSLFPENICGKNSTGQLREYKLVQVPFYPYRYNPVTKKITKVTAGTLTVKASRDVVYEENAVAKKISSTIFANRVFSLSANANDIKQYYSQYSTSASTANYVIITTSALVSASSNLAAFVASKTAKGFTVKVATESDWGGGTGDTAAENIRNYLKNNYITLGIEYVLLIGNPNTSTGDVPMKMAYPEWTSESSYSEAPTDFYYAELSGNWDTDGDGKYGEESDDRDIAGGPDAYSEVFVGRIPYYGSITDLDHILAKTTAYENETDISWRKKALLPMEPSDASTPGYQLAEQIKDNTLVPDAWAYHRIYDDLTGAPAAETKPCNEANVLAAWNSSYYGLVLWWTHGWSQGASDVMSVTSAANLTDEEDTHPAFTYQCSCNNAEPEVSANLAYTLLKRGAVNTVGATRLSWYWVGETDFTNSSSNSGMGYSYAKNLVTNKMSAGAALACTRAKISAYPLWKNYLVFNTYGDPSLKIVPSSETTPEISVAETWINLKTIHGEQTVPVIFNCFNIGGGELTLNTVTSTHSWLTASIQGSNIAASINTAGLVNGNAYSGILTITSNGGTASVSISFTYTSGYLSRFATGSTMYLAGKDFTAWVPNNASYKLEMIGDYTWGLRMDQTAALSNTAYKIVLNGSWEYNWGGGATGKTATLTRTGDNATVSLSAGYCYLTVTEDSAATDTLNVVWDNASSALNIHFKEWGSATAYILHPWNGLTGDRTMTYEGYINNAHWWVISIENAPSDFYFTFTNTNNQWEGSSSYDRHYSNNGSEVYVKAYDATIYTVRP